MIIFFPADFEELDEEWENMTDDVDKTFIALLVCRFPEEGMGDHD